MTKGQFCLHYPLVTLMSTWGEWYKRCPNYLCTSSSSPTDCNSNAYTQTHITTQIVAVKKPKRTDTDNMWDNKHWWKGVNTPRTQALDPINHYIQLVSTHIRIGTARWWEDWNCYDWDIRSASKISSGRQDKSESAVELSHTLRLLWYGPRLCTTQPGFESGL